MSFEIQQKIKRNALEMKEYVTDLYDWEKEMEIRQKAKTQLKKSDKLKEQSSYKKQQSEVRKPQTQETTPVVQRRKDLVRDVNSVGEYYKAWDKFDADKELSKLQEQQQRAYRPYNPYEDSKNNLRAKPKVKINVNGRRNLVNDPTQLKDKGNLHFQTLEYDKAINCYTQCLKKLDEQAVPLQQLTTEKKKLRCVVLSNRAMTYLKINQTTKALTDANQSLVYNDQYSKSYYRRAECLKKLGKYKQSLRDFRTVCKLEPGEAKAETEIKKIQIFLAKRCKQLRESMVVPYNEGLTQGSRRIQIQEVSQFQIQKPQPSTTNYLQEL